MSESLDQYGVYREAEYLCQHCGVRFHVAECAKTARNCPICGEDPGAPEVIGA